MNLEKIEFFSINLEPEVARVMAGIFRCKLSKFPLKYLGVPLSDTNFKVSDWSFLVDKIKKKITKLERANDILGEKNHFA